MTPDILITLWLLMCIFYSSFFPTNPYTLVISIATRLSSLSLLYIFSTNKFYIFVSFVMDIFTSR